MNDILLGTIIGGAIGVAGSAVVAWIQEHYSQQRQLREIHYDKDRELIHRTVEVRAKYLDPLSSQLGKLQACLSDFQDRFYEAIMPYESGTEHGERVLQIEAEKKEVLIGQLKSVEGTVAAIETTRTRIEEAAFIATDMNLYEVLKALVFAAYHLTRAYYKMEGELRGSKNGEDFVYDVDQIIEPMKGVYAGISSSHRRIESLLAGVDAGDE